MSVRFKYNIWQTVLQYIYMIKNVLWSLQTLNCRAYNVYLILLNVLTIRRKFSYTIIIWQSWYSSIAENQTAVIFVFTLLLNMIKTKNSEFDIIKCTKKWLSTIWYHVLSRYSSSSSLLLREEMILIARQTLVTNSMPKNKTAREDICKTITQGYYSMFLDITMKYNVRISRTKNSWVVDAVNTNQKQI